MNFARLILDFFSKGTNTAPASTKRFSPSKGLYMRRSWEGINWAEVNVTGAQFCLFIESYFGFPEVTILSWEEKCCGNYHIGWCLHAIHGTRMANGFSFKMPLWTCPEHQANDFEGEDEALQELENMMGVLKSIGEEASNNCRLDGIMLNNIADVAENGWPKKEASICFYYILLNKNYIS
jgi:hypothetical protein